MQYNLTSKGGIPGRNLHRKASCLATNETQKIGRLVKPFPFETHMSANDPGFNGLPVKLEVSTVLMRPGYHPELFSDFSSSKVNR